jgi:hypothetical protein
MCKISGILAGNDATLGEEDPALDSNDVMSREASPSTRKY